MTLTKPVLKRSLARLKLMRFFPSGEDVLIALAMELAELCKTDTELQELVGDLTSASPEWPGIFALKSRYRELQGARENKALVSKALSERDSHEAGCLGFRVRLDNEQRRVAAEYCRDTFYATNSQGEIKGFPAPDESEGTWGCLCRKATALRSRDQDALRKAVVAELIKRPGWSSGFES